MQERQKTRGKQAVLVVAMALLGIGLMAYPWLSDRINELNSSKAIRLYDEEVQASDPELLAAAWEEAETYNQNLTGQPVHDPFLEGSGMVMPDDYGRVLDVGGVMGYIEVPSIGVYLPIYHGTSESVLLKGIGHLEGSTLPIGGVGRHSVLTGHSGLVSAKLFTDIVELVEGDMFYVHVLGQTLAYRVDQIKVVKPNVTDNLRRLDGRDYCTLLTCTPYGVNTHRLLVRGVRVDYDPLAHDAISDVAGSRADTMVLLTALATFDALLVGFAVTYAVSRRLRRRRRQQLRQQRMQVGDRHYGPA